MSRKEVRGFWIVALLSLLWSFPASADVIDTYAGNGTSGFSGDGGPATQANINNPISVSADALGNLYISAGANRIRKVDANGVITTVAGSDNYGFSGDGGPATQASLYNPCGVFADGLGNFYIADQTNGRIRKVDADGIITTVAGNGYYGFSGDGGPATQASLANPVGVFVDNLANLYIADCNNHRIRKVDANGIITTVAGNGAAGYSGDDVPATQASLYYPSGVFVDNLGNLYIADHTNSRIRKVDANGIITTVAGNGSYGLTGDGGLATQASLRYAYGVFVDGLGNLYFSEYNGNRIRKVDANGIITTMAGSMYGAPGYWGDGGPATLAGLSWPAGISMDRRGNLYIADSNSYRVRRVITDIIPPSTRLSLSGTLGENNWYWSDVVVTLTATDNGSGVARTEYSFDAGGTWNTYTTPFTVTTEGITVIDYRSIDNAGNVEAYLWDEVKIDRIAPVVIGTTPGNGETSVLVGKTIEITFSENVQDGTNFPNIKLYKGKIDPTKEVSTLNDIPAVPGSVLYIDPAANLNSSTTYRVAIPAGSVKDIAGHPLAADYPPYSFDTAQ